MEVEKRSSRSRSKTKETAKEKTKEESTVIKDSSKTRKSVERTSKPDEKRRSSKEVKEKELKRSNDKLEEDAKKKRTKDDSKERKSKKIDEVKPVEPIDKPKKPPSSAKRRELPTKTEPEPSKPSKSDRRPSSSRKLVPPPSSPPPPPPSKSKPQADGEDEYNYEDDFEDYEDDFEDDVEDEEASGKGSARQNGVQADKVAIQSKSNVKSSDRRRSSAFNDQDHIASDHSDDVSTSRAATAASDTSLETPPPNSRPKTVQSSRINFQRAHVTEAQLANYGKMRGRAKELLQLIEFDTVTYDLFDMAPVKDYEYFMQNFGKSNMSQAQIQTGDDSIEREGQTEEIDSENKWCQHPPTDMYGCGGDQAVSDDDARTRMKFDGELLNSVKFRRFVERGGTLISELLSDEYVSQEPTFQSKSTFSFGSSFSTISLGPLAKKCTVGTVAFAESQPTIVAVVFYVQESPLDDITGKTLITVWNVTDLGTPFKLLICDGKSETCCFSPDRSSAIFAGLNDSSIVAWDLQESESLHNLSIPWKEAEVTLREPTYDSAFLCKSQRHETSPIVAVAALNSMNKSSSAQSSAAVTSATSSAIDSYQLISLHGDGSLRIWTALTSVSKEPSELDLGLRPGGRLKLVQSATIKPPMAALRNLSSDLLTSHRSNEIEAFCLGYSSERRSDFYVGTGAGYILHLTRHETKSGPSVYQPDLEALTDVLCISFSPFEPSVLLTGCSDGCIRVYKSTYGRPLATLTLPGTLDKETRTSPVRRVQWSPVSPYRFYSLHDRSLLVTWDLKQDRQAPLNVEKCPKPLITFEISTSVALGSGPANFMALAAQDGSIEIYQLKAEGGKTKYSKSDGAKLLRLVEML